MPSDDRIRMALESLAHPIAEFRSTVEGALGQAELHLATMERDPVAQVSRVRGELGHFADGRLDASGFAALFARHSELPLGHEARFRDAVNVMRYVLAAGNDAFVLTVPAGASLSRAVDDALARIGRAFGAVLAVELMRTGRYQPTEHDALLKQLPFRAWTRAERRYAPPLVVEVHGADLQVGGLADFADGQQRIVLVVQGDCPPAPLARLITPGTMVLQTGDTTGLERVARHEGPAIAAMVPAAAAQFLHDPLGGREPWQRLSVWHMPDAPRHSIGGFSAWQMTEDLQQLRALASAPAEAPLPTVAGQPAPGTDTVDRLASWLLGQSDLTGIA